MQTDVTKLIAEGLDIWTVNCKICYASQYAKAIFEGQEPRADLKGEKHHYNCKKACEHYVEDGEDCLSGQCAVVG